MTAEERVREAVACCGHGVEEMRVCNACIKDAITEAVTEEREACARVADDAVPKYVPPSMSPSENIHYDDLYQSEAGTAADIARKIRARK